MIISKSKITANTQLAKNIWRMVIDSAKISDKYVGAGQFISILANDNWEHPIRRPMSIADVNDNEISIIYKIFGPVTKLLSELKNGDIVDILGPLGNSFEVDYDKFHPVLVGGGIGLSPILNLSECLNKKGIIATTIIGAKSAAEHFLEYNPKENIYLCTDDGSLGIVGSVIDALEIVLQTIENPQIFACGPEKMLSSLKHYMAIKNISGQFSVESYMACGVGFCQGCVISQEKNNNFNLVCKEGPVFDVDEVRFD